MKTPKVIIFMKKTDNSLEDSIKELLTILQSKDPQRIFISLGKESEKVGNSLSKIFSNIPISIEECNISVLNPASKDSADFEVKRKVLELGLETIAKYVDNSNDSLQSLNSEITISLFRAFFLFYSSAMKADYESLYENRRMCILGKLIHSGIDSKDVLITTPWDAYWFLDELDKK
jgi:hypothetical protein